MIEFFIPMERVPTVTHQEKKITVKNGKPIVYEPAELKDARQKFTANFASWAPNEKLKGPIRLTVKWLFPMTKTSFNGQWKDTKPDTDNLNKLPKDVMTDLGFWENDAQVASEIIEKFWAQPSGIYVRVEELEAIHND